MKVRIAAIGKMAAMWQPACDEYSHRLKHYCRLDIVEAPEGEGTHAKQAEGEKLLRLTPQGAYRIALDVGGRPLDSLAFSKKIETLRDAARPVCFWLGGSDGFDAAVLHQADERLSFSSLTFSHQLARVILLEQLYRGFRIMYHQPYHK
ncbi:MAG: 23S rRNA (pseudouridine(1915)-N(3))-methyltransferase RlmH [Christensenellales bacterium]|jgi:23S rRNA (pseudouridine1915-N3)-methyltransferase